MRTASLPGTKPTSIPSETRILSQDKVCYQVTTGMLGKTKTAIPALVLPWEEQAAGSPPLSFLRQVPVHCVSLPAEHL